MSGSVRDHRVKAQTRDVEHLFEAGGNFGFRVIVEPARELGKNLRAGVIAHCDDEGKAMLGTVAGVEPGDARLFRRIQVDQARPALFARRVVGERARLCFLAGQFRMGAQQLELLLLLLRKAKR